MVIPRQWTESDHDALARRVLDGLPAPDGRPASTPQVRMRMPDLDAFERENYVRKALDRLVAAGHVERVRLPNDRVLYWRRTSAGEQEVNRRVNASTADQR